MNGQDPDAASDADGLRTDRIYAAFAGLAGALAVVEAAGRWWELPLIALALLPWALAAAGRGPRLWLFTLLAIAPVVPVVLGNHAGVVTFLTTGAVSRFAVRSDDRRLLVLVTAVVVVLPFLPALGHIDPWAYGAPYFAFGDLFGALIGLLLRRANRLAAELRAVNGRLATAAAREERQRIARDVHDLVAHSLTVVVLHVGGARRVLRADPGAAEEALAEAERVCREALDGIRGVVGLLREEGDRPVVTLELASIADAYRAAGRSVELRVDGDEDALPLAVRVAVYRVVQEGIANAARHTRQGERIEAEVAVGGDAVEVLVRNPIGSSEARPSAGGYGLVGLREQVEALGGRITGAAVAGEWVLSCSLPLRVAAGSAA
ncbi:histidine kinase [Amnibacterium sp. CER49]|uniref:sensor histidine kinase n=1 Tax=Amnibacterium sp. CER49 TaxID=3039161 RepID=UPI00244D3E2F|nr:histidine kinase [Amnibacterium sp. CER49]MDH2444543.1 histidine kinase [Amnibacterium sp. CER49]